MRSVIPAIALLVMALPLGAQAIAKGDAAPPAAMGSIREADLKHDLYALAGDAMRGREAGTVDEMRASVWVAETMRRIGVRPFGEDSSWYQWWSMRRTRIAAPQSSVRADSRTLAIWKDIVPTNNVALDSTAEVIFVGDGSDTTIDVRGRVAIANLVAPAPASIRTTTNTYQYNYARAAVTAQGGRLVRRGAVAVILVADSVAESAMGAIAEVQSRGAYDAVGGVPRFTRNPVVAAGVANAQPRPAPVFLARRAVVADMGAGHRIAIQIRTETFETPSVNVIGIVRGTDAALRDEFVLFSSHQDHDGERYEVDGDRIWNGADDNGSTSVALLAIARAWVRQPGKRSALFVFHGAEERGLLGSRYHVAHPVVPLETIVAVLNGDMIGRNHPDTAALLGSQPPHRNSADLVNIALSANRATSRFVVDSTWDRPTHAEGWYFRSDHVPYAERNVPSLFFTTLLHPDYHTPRDDPQRIDYAKLARMTQWMYMTGWIVANAPRRPALDSGFVLR